ncbi:MAG: DUF3501 family protein [Rhodobacterales bacterium]|nr:DUF3501 family protein [Rhodobacterales bacterium]
MSDRRTISRDDIMPMEQYGAERADRRRAMTALKKDRRVAVGPDATFYFESYDTMWHQIHEMLYIERGGDEQIEDELRAYNPLIPNGRELVATMMFEIDEPVKRARVLGSLGGVEDTISLRIGGETVMAVPEGDVDRTNADGKASSVHFLHFPLTDAQAAALKGGEAEVLLAIGHSNYGHMAILNEATRQALASDLA